MLHKLKRLMLNEDVDPEVIRALDQLLEGTSSFLGLSDTPSSYSGEAGKALFVNPTEDGIIFDTVSTADEKVKVSSSDTTEGYLNDKLTVGSTKLTKTIINNGANEGLELDIDETKIDHNNLLNYDTNRHFLESDISHLNIQDIGTKTHDDIDDHINNVSEDHTQYLLLDGTRVMTGDLDINNNYIKNLLDPSELQDAATKNYVDNAVTSLGVRYYMTDTDDATGYKLTSLDIPTGTTQSYTKGSLSDGDYIMGWISATGEAPDKLIKGVYNWHIYAEKTGGTKDLRLYWELVERKSDNSEVVIATSGMSNLITDKSSYIVTIVLSDDYQQASDSRIVGKIYARVEGGGSAPEITIYYEGDEDSHWEIPANNEIFQNIFVPYEDAKQDVDLGSKDLTTTGTLTAGTLTAGTLTDGTISINSGTISSSSDILLSPTNDIDANNNVIKNLGDPTDNKDAVHKEYVDLTVQGLDWQDSVKSKSLSSPPASPSTGDRYIVATGGSGDWNGHDNDIAEWNGSSWDFTTPTEGTACWVEDDDINYVWNGTSWIRFASTITHNYLSGLQGGTSGEYYHLTSDEYSGDWGSKDLTTTGTISGGTLTDGTLSVSSGEITSTSSISINNIQFLEPNDDLQTAVDQGGIIYLSEGTWNIASTIDVDQGKSVEIIGSGEGTILKSGNFDKLFYITSCKSFRITNLKIDVSNYTANYNIIYVYDLTNHPHVYVENIIFYGDNTNYGVGVKGVSNNITIKYCKNINVPYICQLSGNYNKIIGCRGIKTDNVGSPIFLNGDYNTVTDCHFEGVGAGVYMDGSSYNTIKGNIFIDNAEGVYMVNSCDYNTIVGNTIKGCTYGVYVNGTGNVIRGNVFENNTTDVDNTNGTNTKIPIDVSDDAYDSSWDGETSTAPSKNAIYDKINSMISNDTFSSSWDGDINTAPSKNAVFDAFKSFLKVAIVYDRKSQGTNGGTFYSGAWRVRTLNYIHHDDIGISLSSNQISINTEGTYLIYWSAPALEIKRHKTRLYQTSPSSTVIGYGTTEQSGDDSWRTHARSEGWTVITISSGSSSTFRVEDICTASKSDVGFGAAVGTGGYEFYTMVMIIKIA